MRLEYKTEGQARRVSTWLSMVNVSGVTVERGEARGTKKYWWLVVAPERDEQIMDHLVRAIARQFKDQAASGEGLVVGVIDSVNRRLGTVDVKNLVTGEVSTVPVDEFGTRYQPITQGFAEEAVRGTGGDKGGPSSAVGGRKADMGRDLGGVGESE